MLNTPRKFPEVEGIRGEDRLIYIRQSALGIGDDNETFSVPEIQDLRTNVKTLSAFGDFSVRFIMIGLGGPREVQAGAALAGSFNIRFLPALLS